MLIIYFGPNSCMKIQYNGTDLENSSSGRTVTSKSQGREGGRKHFNTQITYVEEGQTGLTRRGGMGLGVTYLCVGKPYVTSFLLLHLARGCANACTDDGCAEPYKECNKAVSSNTHGTLCTSEMPHRISGAFLSENIYLKTLIL